MPHWHIHLKKNVSLFLALDTLTSACLFSILFWIHFLRCAFSPLQKKIPTSTHFKACGPLCQCYAWLFRYRWPTYCRRVHRNKHFGSQTDHKSKSELAVNSCPDQRATESPSRLVLQAIATVNFYHCVVTWPFVKNAGHLIDWEQMKNWYRWFEFLRACLSVKV